jgi:hypothetical protein
VRVQTRKAGESFTAAGVFSHSNPQRQAHDRDLVRIEARNPFYSGNTPNESVLRFRNRLELQVPFNR